MQQLQLWQWGNNNKSGKEKEKMQLIHYISITSIPMIILIITLNGILEKQNIFDTFIEGTKEGLKIVIGIFPTLVGLFVAIGALRSSGIIDMVINIISPATNLLGIPKEIMPLAMLRPISGSASTAIAVDIMKNCGVDSLIGKIASTLMGSTETTIYTIAIYTSIVKIKKTRNVLLAGLTGDIIGTIASVEIWRILSKSFS